MGTRRIPVRSQLDAADCGVACLRMTLAAHGLRATASELRALTRTSQAGASAAALLAAAREKGLAGKGLRLPARALGQLSPGAILHWRGNHFVVLRNASARHVEIVDPSSGPRRLSMDEAQAQFAGVALDFGALPQAGIWTRLGETGQRAAALLGATAIRPRDLIPFAVVSVAQVAALLLLCWFAAAVIDRTWSSGSRWNLLWPVAALITGAIAFTLVGFSRSRIVTHLATRAEAAMQDRLVRHVLSLPPEFFLGRGQSDLVMRMRTGASLRGAVPDATLLADAVLLHIFTLAALLADWRLALPVVAGSATAVFLSRFARNCHDARGAPANTARATVQSGLLRTTGGVLEIRAAGGEAQAAGRAGHAHGEELAALAEPATGALAAAVAAASRWLVPASVLLLGAELVNRDGLTWGTVVAFTGFGTLVMGATTRALEAVHRWGELKALVDRAEHLLDLQPGSHAPEPLDAETGLALRLTGLTGSPIDIHPGQLVAITGPVGAGKTRFAMAVAGLTTPGRGSVAMAPHYLRRKAFVPHEPYLFAGTVRANITLLRPEAGEVEVERASRLAGLHDEVMAMPVRYGTMIAAGGAGLPASTRQRIALARALLTVPHLLVIDEGTNLIDADSMALHQRLHEAVPVCVVVTRDPELIDIADVVVDLDPSGGGTTWPLSTEQQALWLTSELNDKIEFPLIRVYELSGQIDPRAFRSALDTVVSRHEALRLVVRSGADSPTLHLSREPIVLRATRVSARDDDQFQRFAMGLLAQDCAGWTNDVTGAVRARMISRGTDRNLLLFSFNNMLLDRQSLDVFADEFFACVEGRPLPPAQPGRYTDYVVRQHERLDGPRADKALAFWRGVYAQLPPRLEMDGLRPLDVVEGYDEVSYRLAGVALRRVRDLAADKGCTLFTFLVAALGLSIFARTDQSSIAVHVPMDGRSAAERKTMGLYVVMRPLVLRRPSAGFEQFLTELRHHMLLSMRYREAPAEPVFALPLVRSDETGVPWHRSVIANHLPHSAGRSGTQMRGGAVTSSPMQHSVPISRGHLLNLKVYEARDAVDVVLDYDVAAVPVSLVKAVIHEMATCPEWMVDGRVASRGSTAAPVVAMREAEVPKELSAELRLLQKVLETDRDDIGFWAAGGTVGLAQQVLAHCGATSMAPFREGLPLRELARRLVHSRQAGQTPFPVPSPE